MVLFSGLLVIYWLPWYFLPLNWVNLSLLIFQFILLVAYSSPPIRLKERGIPGIFADAFYGYVIPVMVVFTTFAQFVEDATPVEQILFPVFFIWSFTAGLRGIINSQIQDIDNDRKSGTVTFAVRAGKDRALRIITRYLLPLEYLAYFSIVILISLEVYYFWAVFLFYLLWKAFQVKYIWVPAYDPFDLSAKDRSIRLYGNIFLTEFYQKWWPIVMLIALCVNDQKYIVLGILHLLLFKNGFFEFFLHDIRYIPNGIYNLRHRNA